MALSVASPAFPNGQRIPERYSKDGGNVSPPLEWKRHATRAASP